MHMARIVVDCVPAELGAVAADAVQVHAEALRPDLWFFITTKTQLKFEPLRRG